MCHRYYWFLLLLNYCHALIVPQELPSILSLIFSTIPQVKKGTDSRVGFGFRLGEHADLQVLLELGPQKETQPIAPDVDSNTNKRNVNQDDYSQDSSSLSSTSSLGTKEAASWLKNWSNDMQAKQRKKLIPRPPSFVTSALNDDNDNNVKVIPIVSESALKQLQTLYGNTGNNSTNEINQQKRKEEIQADLSDVSLD